MNSITPINQQTQTEIENSTTHAPGSDDVQIGDDGLSYKELLFLDAYLGDARGNATKAAQIAGYGTSTKSSQVQGSVLLSKPMILARVHAHARAVMGEHELVHHLATYIRNPPSNPIERNAWIKAIETMMKYQGLLMDKVEHSGTVQQQVTQVIAVLHPDGMTTIDSTATETQTNTHNE